MILMSLFSVFDPSTSFYLSMNWISLVMFLIMMPVSFFYLSGKVSMLVSKVLMMIKKEFYDIAKFNGYGIVLMVISVFFFILVNNVMGLVPFIFVATSHPMVTISLGLVFWMGFFLMMMFKNFKNLMVHMVPEGSPMVLSFFMVIIESISLLVRPLTLSVRLAANMMAGHLIIGLISMISMESLMGGFMSVMMQMFLLILEIGVGLIQSFVFGVLLLLYVMECY